MVTELQKKAIKIPDEVGLVIELITDPLRNHLLKHIIPDKNILRKIPETFFELLSIYVKKVGFQSMLASEPMPPHGEIGYSWSSLIELHIIAPKDCFIYYPPKVPGGVPLETNRYDGAECVLPIPAWILHALLSENRQYTSTFDPTFQIDDIQPVAYAYVDFGYGGVKDMAAIILTYRFDFEVVNAS